MASEKEWVRSLQPRIEKALRHCDHDEWHVYAGDGEKLAYAYQILTYDKNGPDRTQIAEYETDLLIYDSRENEDWIPRVVIEFKMGVTTHDALTYSAKAATHKRIHPHLRYGILIGGEPSVPGRLMQHGAYFDFMAVWSEQEPTTGEWKSLIAVLAEEIHASRALQTILSDSRSKGRKKYKLVHRPLRLTDPVE
jgi:hypothetical protein